MKMYKELLGFNDKWMIIIGSPVVAFLMTAMMFGDYLVDNPSYFFNKCATISFVYTIVYWLTFRQLILFLREKYPLYQDTVKRLVYQSGLVLVVYFVLKLILDPVLEVNVHPAIDNVLRHQIGMSISSLLVAFLVLGVYEVIYFYSQLNKSLIEKEQLRHENVQSQLEGLKNQVNPHFLFNSLNTLTYIIPETPETAVKFVQKLSKVYRYILEIRDKKLITVRDELDFLKSYTFLLKERFGDNLQIDFDIPDEFLNDKIIPLSLQILFENAIKHNIISTQKPLVIEVFVKRGHKLIVRNNLQKKKQTMNSTKFGLQNIKNRYRFFSDEEVEVIVTTGSFMVVLPLVKSPVLV